MSDFIKETRNQMTRLTGKPVHSKNADMFRSIWHKPVHETSIVGENFPLIIAQFRSTIHPNA